MTKEIVVEEKSRNKVITTVLIVLLSIGCLLSAIGYLTDIDLIEDPLTPLGQYEPDTPDSDSDGFNSFISLDNPNNSPTATPAVVTPNEQKNQYFDINFSGSTPDISNAKPGQSFPTNVSVTNEGSSTDAAYIKVELVLPTVTINNSQSMVFNYHETDNWDVSYIPQSDSMKIVAIYKDPVKAGEQVNLFDSVSINSSLDREHIVSLKGHSQAQSDGLNIQFDATGISATGFNSYRDAFAA